MALTRDFKETVNARVQRDSEFTIALLDEAISLFLNGEPETARLILRDIGNPTMDNLTAIFNVLRKKLNVDINVKTTVIYH
jgi:hypothetical protein